MSLKRTNPSVKIIYNEKEVDMYFIFKYKLVWKYSLYLTNVYPAIEFYIIHFFSVLFDDDLNHFVHLLYFKILSKASDLPQTTRCDELASSFKYLLQFKLFSRVH